jgi:hypothetical protein
MSRAALTSAGLTIARHGSHSFRRGRAGKVFHGGARCRVTGASCVADATEGDTRDSSPCRRPRHTRVAKKCATGVFIQTDLGIPRCRVTGASPPLGRALLTPPAWRASRRRCAPRCRAGEPPVRRRQRRAGPSRLRWTGQPGPGLVQIISSRSRSRSPQPERGGRDLDLDELLVGSDDVGGILRGEVVPAERARDAFAGPPVPWTPAQLLLSRPSFFAGSSCPVESPPSSRSAPRRTQWRAARPVARRAGARRRVSEAAPKPIGALAAFRIRLLACCAVGDGARAGGGGR